MGAVVPLWPESLMLADLRQDDRLLRLTWPGVDVAVPSMWRETTCVASTRLSGADAARLVCGLTEGLAETRPG